MSRRTAAWLAWSLCAVCVVLMGLALLLNFLAGELSLVCHGAEPEVCRSVFPQLHLDKDQIFALLAAVLSLAYPTVGALIASRLPANPIGWIFCGVGLLYAGNRFTEAYANYALQIENSAFPGGEYVAWLSEGGQVVIWLSGVFVILLFPNGHLLSRRWRIVAWMAVCGAMLRTLSGGITTYEFLLSVSNVVGLALLLASVLAALFSLFVRLHRAQGDERQQLKWFLYAAVPAGVGFSFDLFSHFFFHFTDLAFNNRLEMCGPYGEFCWYIVTVYRLPLFSLMFVPVFTYIAILRYRLYDIDVVINRTLVYGALSACVVGIYVLAVVALGTVFQARGNLAIALLATALVAVLFQPLRARLQRSVNRLMYGERDDPYAVISRLGRRLEATLAPDTVLPTLVETIAQALKLPYAAILLKEGEGFRTAAAYGSPRGEPETLPLVYQREEIGRLVLSPRAPREGFSDADRNLLEDLARQAEVAVHAVRLTTDLQHSRERLVATREEERRRLRRDLHDGLGSQLAGLNVQAGALRRLIPGDPAAADELVVELREELRSAITDIRRLVYDLRPPALDDLGLAEALRRLAERYGSEGEQLSVVVEAPEDLPDLPAAVEVAVYRIAQEALTNVARHARTKRCVVRLAVNEEVALEIGDDGVGIPKERGAGVGLSSMRERASELGGSCIVEPAPKAGTRVLVHLPLPKESPKE